MTDLTPEELAGQFSQPQTIKWDGLPGIPAKQYEQAEQIEVEFLYQKLHQLQAQVNAQGKATTGYVIATAIAILILVFFK